jgi:hypothetical protein
MNKNSYAYTVYGTTYQVYLEEFLYADNKRKGLMLRDVHTHEPITKASLNLPNYKLAVDEVIIKDYSENEGIMKWLLKHDIVTQTRRESPEGMVDVYVCKVGANWPR